MRQPVEPQSLCGRGTGERALADRNHRLHERGGGGHPCDTVRMGAGKGAWGGDADYREDIPGALRGPTTSESGGGTHRDRGGARAGGTTVEAVSAVETVQ